MLKPIQEKKLSHYFSILDHDNNGLLEEKDFYEIGVNICSNLNIGPNSNEYEYIIGRSKGLYNQLIKDLKKASGDVITREEWLQYFDEEIITARNVDLLKNYILMTVKYVFDLCDQNSDGFINIEEYTDMFLIYGLDINYISKSFMRLDENNDEVISKQELVSAVKEFFVSSDPKASGNWIFGNWEDS